MFHPFVCAIIINNNRRDDVLDCIKSLYQSDYKNLGIILLDNLSTDHSVEAVHQLYPDVRVIQLYENLGYAGNNNIGIKTALEQNADWLFLLNDDTILDPVCLSSLVEVGESDPDIGMIGPMVYNFDEPNVIQSAGGTLGKYWLNTHIGKDEPDRGQFNITREVEWITGCAILARRKMVEQIGLLDENYFLYWEETEWCIRAGKAGWRILHNPQAKLWHKGVQRNYQPMPYVTYYVTRNRLLTLAKHKAPWKARLFALSQIMRTLMSWSIRPKWRFQREHRNAMLKGLIDFLQHRSGVMPS